MRISSVVLMLLHALVASGLASGAAVDRYESDRQRHTAVINLLGTTKDKRAEEESRSAATATAKSYQEEEDEYYYYEEEDYYEDGDGLSGDYEPRVAMSSKPKDPSVAQEKVAETTGEKTTRGKKKRKGKGKGRKRDPCLKKFKNFCIHGTCRYQKEAHAASCVCHRDYSGERCEFFTLPVQSPEGYSRTTALAVVAVVLSSVCLIIIGLLLMLRFHKRGAYDVESEEKVKLGSASSH